jgi:hypothetical protein
MTHRLLTVFCLVLSLGLIGAFKTVSAQNLGKASIQALDKITTRISTLEIEVDKPVQFGTLLITLKRCQKTPPEETPETAAYVEIDELFGASASSRRFAGWFFASSPALSALDHPVYDFWLLDCSQPIKDDSESR